MNIAGVMNESIADGEGVRMTIFVSGCSHNCKGCHNPKTHDPSYGKPLDKKMFERLLFEFEKRPYMSGITMSGGDPLYPDNRITVEGLLSEFKARYPEKDVWLYTGYTWDEIKDVGLIKYVDVLVDGPFVESLRDVTLSWRGSSNQRVIDVRESMQQGSVVLRVE